MDNVDPSVAEHPIVLYVLLAVSVLGVIFGGITKSTTGLGAWLASLRRIGADHKAADLTAKEQEIQNLSEDLKQERLARQADRLYFQKELDRRDKLSREHVAYDWQVYNILVRAGLWDEKMGDGPPPLF